MKESDLLKLADLNLVQYWCDSARWVPGSQVICRDDIVLIDSALDFPGCSAAFSLSESDHHNPPQFVETVKAFFRGRRKYFSLLLRGHVESDLIDYCSQAKMLLVENQPGMAIERPLKAAPLPADCELRWVDAEQSMQDFSQVVSQAYLDLSFPAESSSGYFKQAQRVLSPYTLMAVVYSGAEPSCAAMAMLTHGIAGIYWVGTVKEARGRGLAEYCVTEVGNAAFDLGARSVILQASRFGEPLYRRMGYREYTRYPWFICSSR